MYAGRNHDPSTEPHLIVNARDFADRQTIFGLAIMRHGYQIAFWSNASIVSNNQISAPPNELFYDKNKRLLTIALRLKSLTEFLCDP